MFAKGSKPPNPQNEASDLYSVANVMMMRMAAICSIDDYKWVDWDGVVFGLREV